MDVAIKHRRGTSPAPSRGARDPMRMGDVSKAAPAGTPEAQEMQLPYLESFSECLAKHYPGSTNIGQARKKLGGFTFQVHCFRESGWDPSEVATKIKKEFPNANVKNDGSGEYEWFIPYVKPRRPKAVGTIIHKILLGFFASCLLVLLLWQRQVHGDDQLSL